MLSLIFAIACAPSGPDLACHHLVVDGTRRLAVSREQWNGIRKALVELDRKTLSSLISDKGVAVTIRSTTTAMGKDGKVHWIPTSAATRRSKARFLDIGDDTEYHRNGPAVSTAVGGDTLVFKWLWVDLTHVVQKTKRHGSRQVAYDVRTGRSTWEIYGWTDPKPGNPSSRVLFGCEGDRLVIEKVEVTMQAD